MGSVYPLQPITIGKTMLSKQEQYIFQFVLEMETVLVHARKRVEDAEMRCEEYPHKTTFKDRLREAYETERQVYKSVRSMIRSGEYNAFIDAETTPELYCVKEQLWKR